MPTGYTHVLYEGEQSLKEFVFECAKAFFIEFRDAEWQADLETTLRDGAKEKIKYVEGRLQEAQKEFDEAQLLTTDSALELLQKIYESDLAEWRERQPVLITRAERFARMIAKIKDMTVPKDDLLLNNLKKFMLDQLEMESFRQDSMPTPPTLEDAKRYVLNEKKWAAIHLVEEQEKIKEVKQSLAQREKSLKLLEELVKETP